MKDRRRVDWMKAKGIEVPAEFMPLPEPAPVHTEKREGLGVGVIAGGLALVGATCVAERVVDMPTVVEAIGIGLGYLTSVAGAAIAGGALFTREVINGGNHGTN